MKNTETCPQCGFDRGTCRASGKRAKTRPLRLWSPESQTALYQSLFTNTLIERAYTKIPTLKNKHEVKKPCNDAISAQCVISSVVNLEITILISRISRYRLSKSRSRSCRLYQSLDLELDLELHNLDLNLVLEHNFLDLY